MSKRFAERFAQSIPELNQELYPFARRVELIQNAADVPSPQPRISKNSAFVAAFANLITNYFGGMLIPVTDTNSMDPWIDAGHRAIVIPFQSFAPFRKQDLQVGDIIMFDRALDGATNVLHRIDAMQDDGKFVLTRGDNTTVFDGQTVQDKIHYVCVGVIY